MLAAWADFVRTVDPDVVTGYNIQDFDIWYLLSRAQRLGLERFAFLGRLRNVRSVASKYANLNGRVQVDVLQIVKRDHKLRSYKLNAVAEHFLNEKKDDVKFTEIAGLQHGTDADRARLAQYCMQDSRLVFRLHSKLMIVLSNVQLARAAGVTMNDALMRGQQVRVFAAILRKCREQCLVVPACVSDDEIEEYPGAHVIEPRIGFYNEPVATLDFTSLYP
ncbi:DNA polymerase delta catalytic subunit-like protein, partial [Dinothrombium tinctorium]